MNRKHFKKLVWIPVGILSLFIITLTALSITAQIMLTPDMSRKIIRRFAPDYYEGGLKLGKADLSVFKNFPRLTADIDSLVLTYPAARLTPDARDFRVTYTTCLMPMRRAAFRPHPMQCISPRSRADTSARQNSTTWRSCQTPRRKCWTTLTKRSDPLRPLPLL